MITPQDRTLRVGGLQVRYWAEGTNTALTPLLLIHGLGAYIETWRQVIPALAARRPVYAVDLPGCGRSDKPADYPYTVTAFVQFIHDFLSALGIDQAHLVGHSLGGAIALRATLAYPQMVRRLGLVSSAGLGKEVGAGQRLVSLPLVGELLLKPGLETSRSGLISMVYDPAAISDELVRLDYQMFSQPGAKRAWLKTARAMGGYFGQKSVIVGPDLQKLAALPHPTLVLWGREDPLIPVAHAKVAERIPGARVQIIEDCGHLPQTEHPQVFAQALNDFLVD